MANKFDALFRAAENNDCDYLNKTLKNKKKGTKLLEAAHNKNKNPLVRSYVMGQWDAFLTVLEYLDCSSGFAIQMHRYLCEAYDIAACQNRFDIIEKLETVTIFNDKMPGMIPMEVRSKDPVRFCLGLMKADNFEAFGEVLKKANSGDLNNRMVFETAKEGKAKYLKCILSLDFEFEPYEQKQSIEISTHEEIDYKWNALHYACMNGHEQCVKLLISINDGVLLNSATHSGLTGLHIAAFFGKGPVVRHLLESNADHSLLNNKKKTALDLALDAAQDSVLTVMASGSAEVRSMLVKRLQSYRINIMTYTESRELLALLLSLYDLEPSIASGIINKIFNEGIYNQGITGTIHELMKFLQTKNDPQLEKRCLSIESNINVDGKLRGIAAAMLGSMKSRSAIQPLVATIAQSELVLQRWPEIHSAIDALVSIGAKEALEPLKVLLKNSDLKNHNYTGIVQSAIAKLEQIS